MKRLILAAVLAVAAPLVAQERNSGHIVPGGSQNVPVSNLGVGLCVGSSESITTTGTAEETLETCVIPANSLGVGNDFAGFTVAATYTGAANANSKTATLEAGGNDLASETTSVSGDLITLAAECFVKTATTVQCLYNEVAESGTPSVGILDVTLTFTADIDIDFRATTPTQAGDITLTSYRVTLVSSYSESPDFFWPLLAPPSSGDAKAYSFQNDPAMGCYRGLAATWGFDSLVCANEDASDFSGAYLQLSINPPSRFLLLSAKNADSAGGTFFANSPGGATPWGQVTMTGSDYTIGGNGAVGQVSASGTTAGVGTVTIETYSGALTSLTTFGDSDTTFSDPVLIPDGTLANPGLAPSDDPNTGILSLTDGQIDISSDGTDVATFSDSLIELDTTNNQFEIDQTTGIEILSTLSGSAVTLAHDSGANEGTVNASSTALGGSVTMQATDGTNQADLALQGGTFVQAVTLQATDGTATSTFTLSAPKAAASASDGANTADVWAEANDTFLDAEAGMYAYNATSGAGAGVQVAALDEGVTYVSLDTDNNSLAVNNDDGIFFNTFGSKPTCTVSVRGSTWRTTGGAGVADTFEVCVKEQSGAYSWIPMIAFEASGLTTLTESSATNFATMAIPQGDYVGGEIRTTVICADATDTSTISDTWTFTCHNRAGNEICGVAQDQYAISPDAPISWGTRTVAYTAGTDVVTFTMETSCTITQTTLDLAWEFDQVDALRQTVTAIP